MAWHNMTWCEGTWLDGTQHEMASRHCITQRTIYAHNISKQACIHPIYGSSFEAATGTKQRNHLLSSTQSLSSSLVVSGLSFCLRQSRLTAQVAILPIRVPWSRFFSLVFQPQTTQLKVAQVVSESLLEKMHFVFFFWRRERHDERHRSTCTGPLCSTCASWDLDLQHLSASRESPALFQQRLTQ